MVVRSRRTSRRRPESPRAREPDQDEDEAGPSEVKRPTKRQLNTAFTLPESTIRWRAKMATHLHRHSRTLAQLWRNGRTSLLGWKHKSLNGAPQRDRSSSDRRRLRSPAQGNTQGGTGEAREVHRRKREDSSCSSHLAFHGSAVAGGLRGAASAVGRARRGIAGQGRAALYEQLVRHVHRLGSEGLPD